MTQSLTITDGTSIGNILTQIDEKLLILGVSSPIGIVPAADPGIFFFDTAHQTLYFCLFADGTIGGTTWQAVGFVLPVGSITQQGIVQFATQADALAGTSQTLALTPLAGTVYAKAGNNADITQLSGLQVALTRAVGGTGISTSIPQHFVLAGTSGGNWVVSQNFGLGPDGGGFVGGGVINLNYLSPPRFTIQGTYSIILPAYGGSATAGFLFRIKMIGPSDLTFTVADGAFVDGVPSYNVNTSAVPGVHYPSIDLQLINGSWWEV